MALLSDHQMIITVAEHITILVVVIAPFSCGACVISVMIAFEYAFRTTGTGRFTITGCRGFKNGTIAGNNEIFQIGYVTLLNAGYKPQLNVNIFQDLIHILWPWFIFIFQQYLSELFRL